MKHLARNLRKRSTDAEQLLWRHLRARRMAGFKFRRQFVVEPYIVDFICLETKLIVEADGGQHLQNRDDEHRTAYLENLGYRIIRFWNHDILNDTQTVLSHIHHKLMTGEAKQFTIRPATWQQDETALRTIREQVFMQEQHVPEALEWDGEDEAAFHLLAEDADSNPIGTARMLADGHIGRVAVLAAWRSRGIGKALMLRMLQQARTAGHHAVFLDAQVEAIDFYRTLGFCEEGEVFMDAGIPHLHMRRTLDT